jgi:hypothetical protein
MPTSYEIYQTYLRGPAAVICLFEQALGTNFRAQNNFCNGIGKATLSIHVRKNP